MYYTRFWEKLPNSRKWEQCWNTACFRGANEDAEKTIYLCPVDSRLTKEQVKFYLKFLSEILDSANFQFYFNTRKDRFNSPRLHILFKLNTPNNKLNPVQKLLYLTAFRYPDEYPEVVEEFFKRGEKIKDIEELFKIFQVIHFEYTNVKTQSNFIKKFGGMSGHGLIYGYGWESSYYNYTPISLSRFWDNLFNKNTRGVTAFFS